MIAIVALTSSACEQFGNCWLGAGCSGEREATISATVVNNPSKPVHATLKHIDSMCFGSVTDDIPAGETRSLSFRPDCKPGAFGGGELCTSATGLSLHRWSRTLAAISKDGSQESQNVTLPFPLTIAWLDRETKALNTATFDNETSDGKDATIAGSTRAVTIIRSFSS